MPKVIFEKSKKFNKDSGQSLSDLILPAGYPETVSSDYAEYQLYDSLQALCSTINSLLTTRAVLLGLGVGDPEATSLQALLAWTLRDGVGMLGRVVFAWRFARLLDYDAKTWRFMADVFNDLGMVLSLLAPLYPDYKVWVMCAGTVFYSLCSVAGQSTRQALTQHFAISNNMADIAAKDGTQETIVNLVGMILGTFLITQIDTLKHVVVSEGVTLSMLLSWALFLALVMLHLWFNYRAVKAIVIPNLNSQRVELVLRHYLASFQDESVAQLGTVPSPKHISRQEKIVSRLWSLDFRLVIGALVEDDELLAVSTPAYRISFSSGQFSVALLDSHSRLDILEAIFCSYAIHYNLGKGLPLSLASRSAADFTANHFQSFLHDLKKAGWSPDLFQFSYVDLGYRFRYDDSRTSLRSRRKKNL